MNIISKIIYLILTLQRRNSDGIRYHWYGFILLQILIWILSSNMLHQAGYESNIKGRDEWEFYKRSRLLLVRNIVCPDNEANFLAIEQVIDST